MFAGIEFFIRYHLFFDKDGVFFEFVGGVGIIKVVVQSAAFFSGAGAHDNKLGHSCETLRNSARSFVTL